MKSFRQFAALSVSLFLLFSSSLANATILVISPHPDDDILTASGVVYSAVKRGDSVKVVYMTNGDYNGISAGNLRQGEAVNAQAYLGMTENNLIFLGYPDGFLHDIYTSYTTSDQTFTATQTTGQSATYGNRGLGGADYHFYKFGSHANYNSYNIQKDLASIITDYKPDHIFTVGDFDQYSDHYTTYYFLKYALAAVRNINPTYNPTIHKTCVWCDPLSWPNPIDPTSFFSPIPADALTPFGLNWNDRESLDVSPEMQSTKYMTNKKFLALSAEGSQGGVTSYGQYIHKDEIFWTENYVGNNKPPVPNAGLDQSVSEGATVQLDGSGSHDPDMDTLSFQWVQSGGIAVQLSNSNIVNPTFNAPTGLKQDEVLTFQLVVNDGSLSSVPDSVNVIVHATNPDPYANLNIAPFAVVTASSENAASGQLAIKAVDGVIDGAGTYPGDATKEWVTNGEKAGAWLQLSWPSPYTVNQVILYDRPNSNDQILSATLLFSDGTTLQIGPLDNLGGATAYTLPTPVTVTNLKMTVTAFSSTTQNVGLAEIEVYGVPAGMQNSQTTISSSSPNPSAYGSSVVFTATVSAGAFGTVTFKDGGLPLGTVTLPGGPSNTATFSTSALTGGTHSITAVYNGDTYHYTSTSNPLSHTVNQLVTTTYLTSSSPTVTFGSTVTFTATVSPSAATGTVTFMDGTAILGTGALSSSTATLTTSSLGGGAHSITAVYGGDTNFTGSASSVLLQTVDKAFTTVGVASSVSPSTFGDMVTFTATVSPSAATGTVTFMDGASTLGTGTLSSGTAAYSTTALIVGSHSITAVYGGDTNFTGSTSSAITETVDKASTTTGVISSTNPSAYGSSVTFTTTVGPSTATGTVTFMDGAVTLGTVTLSSGKATYTTGALDAGSHSIRATYSGDTNFSTSSSPAITQNVNQTPTTTTISAPALMYNADGIVTVTVTSGSFAVTGNVTLTVDGGAPTTKSLGNGSASFTISSPTVGSHSLSASFAAQGNFGASSNTGTLTINPAPTSMSISASAIEFGADGSVTVTVSSGILIPTGNVSLTVDNGTPILGSVIGTGTATFTITKPTLGNHILYATFEAQGNFSACSASGQLSVGLATTTTTITPPATITYGANGFVTVTVSSGAAGTPAGSVSLSVDSTTLPAQGLVNGSTTFTITSPSAGNHALSASYAAQGNFGASSGTGTLIANKTVLTVTANNASKAYNTANPVFTASYSGFVNGDTAAALSGTPSLTTTATLASSVGTYPITAAAGSLSATNYGFSFVNSSLSITPASTITGVTSSADPSIYGASMTLTATVISSTAGIPTGFVTFMDGATTLGAGSLSGGGTATIATSSLGGGVHSITAVYGGDTNFTGSTSSGFSQAVNKASTTIGAISSASPSTYGSSVTFIAAVTPSTATGTVTFMDGATTLGTGTLFGGTATYSTTALNVGSHSITAVYGGDANFSTSTASSGINQAVLPDGNFDVMKALRIADGIDPLEASDLVHGDVAPLVNGMPQPDGKIDMEDVVVLLRKAEGLSTW